MRPRIGRSQQSGPPHVVDPEDDREGGESGRNSLHRLQTGNHVSRTTNPYRRPDILRGTWGGTDLHLSRPPQRAQCPALLVEDTSCAHCPFLSNPFSCHRPNAHNPWRAQRSTQVLLKRSQEKRSAATQLPRCASPVCLTRSHRISLVFKVPVGRGIRSSCRRSRIPHREGRSAAEIPMSLRIGTLEGTPFNGWGRGEGSEDKGPGAPEACAVTVPSI